MKTARFGTGVAILISIPGWRVAPSGPVSGAVLLNGRPLACGMIYLDPDDPWRGESTSAKIDENGRFACDPDWRRDRAARMRFRMRIVLLPRHHALNAPESDPGEGRDAAEDVRPGPIIEREVALGPGPAHIELDLRARPPRGTRRGNEGVDRLGSRSGGSSHLNPVDWRPVATAGWVARF